VPFVLIFLEPALGTAMIIGCIWLGMALVAGIRKRHLLLLAGIGAIIFSILWVFVLKPYQKARIVTYVDPFADVHGSGYNARQAMIAVGSGGAFGKGVGYGTQSRLRFLPEYQTDFIFAAFAEEWGFVGALILLILFGLLLARILTIALHGASNFETLFASGVMILFVSHIVINVAMNMGLLPVTGITLPFMSYGGSHLVTEFGALGILSSMRNYTRRTHPEDLTKEFEGL
jgi:rod shape determining protein RodA